MRSELLVDRHRWLRVAGADWADPLDPTFAQSRGGRWNPPHSFPALYLNEDIATARLNTAAFIGRWPYEPEDLRGGAGPVLIAATLPRRQRVADVHSPPGIAAAGLHGSYPLDGRGVIVSHDVCQPIGAAIKSAGLRGVLCRSANFAGGAGRELAWFPATTRSLAKRVVVTQYEDWFWG